MSVEKTTLEFMQMLLLIIWQEMETMYSLLIVLEVSIGGLRTQVEEVHFIAKDLPFKIGE
jgi:hypothetical protein